MSRPFDPHEFYKWKAKVDAIIQRRTGMSADDLPDFCYADYFENGETPGETAREAIMNAREY